ncbi:MAG: hypothetical protein ACKPKO_38595, partial [Candidatus Fonsibacter sp.]
RKAETTGNHRRRPKHKKWRLEPALKRARLYDIKLTMEDVKRWRIENYNLEKRPRKFNSWVANRPFEEFQAGLFFLDDLRQREKAAKEKIKEPVDYVAGLLAVDTFSQKIAVVPIEGEEQRGPRRRAREGLQADGRQAGDVIHRRGARADLEP